MKQFFAEFEFEAIGGRYWLPLTISATDIKAAADFAGRHEAALREHYKIVNKAGPTRVFSPHWTDEYRRQRLRGRPAVLHVQAWRVEIIDEDPPISLDEALRLIEAGHYVRASRVGQVKIPVGVVGPDGPEFDEFLSINLVLAAEPERS